jgi:hypothetical protein
MRQFVPEELVRFLTAVNDALAGPATTVLIGGSAAALAYQVARGTRDIDTWTTVDDELADAVARAREETGLDVPFSCSGVADAPYEFESRLERALPALEKLTVLVPEKHDLVLMKVVRCYEHDLEAIEDIHRNSLLELETLVGRFETEMGAIVIDPTRLRGNFLVMIERLFPREVAGIEARLEGRSS